MVKIKLGKVLFRDPAVASIISELMALANSHILVRDANEEILLDAGDRVDDDLAQLTHRHPITYNGEIVGWVIGDKHAAHIAALFIHLIEKEAEKKSLALELLDLYREINLLFNLSEKLSASLEVTAVARLALQEASRLIAATGGSLILMAVETGEHRVVAQFGAASGSKTGKGPIDEIVRRIAKAGQARIVNELPAAEGYTSGESGIASLVCAPLKAKNQVIGVVLLVNEDPAPYSAGDLKLLNTLASQVAPALDSALLHEKTMREAREREDALQRQINELHIELDEQRQKRQVAEITETERFRQISLQAKKLRKIIEGKSA
jgi:transcriptional regulator with GAF, ATPase, and Fis domain